MKFCKAQTNGNDFVILERDADKLSLAQKKLIADRKYGIGCDQIIFVNRKNGHFCLDFYNQDGSHANMCGNGSCAAAFFIKNKYGFDSLELEVFIDFFSVPVRGSSQSELAQACLDRFGGHDVVDSREYHIAPPESLYKARIIKDEVTVEFPIPSRRGNVVITGNNHMVLDMSKIGEVSEFAKLNPECNIHFVETLSNDTLRVKSFEKGVGWTLSCGSGAVAVGYHSKLQGRINIIQDGGKSIVEVDETHVNLITFPKIVYEGEYYE